MKTLNEEFKLNLPEKKYSYLKARLQKRITALIIDIFILEVFFISTLAKPLHKYFAGGIETIIQSVNNIPPFSLTAFIVGTSIITWLYFSLSDHFLTGSIGKQLVGIRVVSPNLQASFIRNISSIFIFPFNWIVFLDVYYLIKFKHRWLEEFTNSYSYEIQEI